MRWPWLVPPWGSDVVLREPIRWESANELRRKAVEDRGQRLLEELRSGGLAVADLVQGDQFTRGCEQGVRRAVPATRGELDHLFGQPADEAPRRFTGSSSAAVLEDLGGLAADRKDRGGLTAFGTATKRLDAHS